MRTDPSHHSPTLAGLLATTLFLGGIAAGFAVGRAGVARARAPYEGLAGIAEVLGTIHRDYYEDVPREELVDAAQRGIVGELDPQSRWLSPSQVAALRDEARGTTTGLGLEVARTEGVLQIVAVVPEGPAARNGLAEGDRILAVDGTPVADLDPGQLEGSLTGAAGRTTALTVLRAGWEAPRTVTAAQEDEVARRSTSGALLGDVAYVRVELFQQGTAAELLATARDLAAPLGGLDRLRGLVVDLRDNPGGLLTEAVATADLFLDDGVLVSTRVRSGAPREAFRATPGGFPPGLPVVALVNGMSASASEVVAGALQDTGRGRLVGESTYGKGTVQQVYLQGDDDTAALKLTVGQYYTPSGAPVAPREGRAPDVLVPYPRPPTALSTLRARIASIEDRALQEELAALLQQAAPAQAPAPARIPWDQPIAERVAGDPQLQAALAVLAERP